MRANLSRILAEELTMKAFKSQLSGNFKNITQTARISSSQKPLELKAVWRVQDGVTYKLDVNMVNTSKQPALQES